MLLSDGDIRRQIAAGRVVLEPYDEAMVQPSSVDVRLDRYFRVFENHRYPHIDPATEQPDLTRLVEPDGEDPFILHPGEFALASTYEVVTLPADVAGRLEGKALALSTPVPTPRGWSTMGGLRPGDEVFDDLGRPVAVAAVSPVLAGRPCREVVFSDHQRIVADAAHQWVTTTRAERRRGGGARVRTTDEIAAALRCRDGWNHHVPMAAPVQYPRKDLPVDPYLLGARLGAGTGTAALLGEEHVPEDYLTASVPQRLALLQGLMDSGGHVDARGRCGFVSAREDRSDAVVELAAGLGLGPVGRKERAVLRGVDLGPAYRVTFRSHLPVFRSGRTLTRLRTGRPHRSRAIVDVRPVASQPVRCIRVAAARGRFLVGRTFIPTHNSSLGRLGLLTHSTAGFIDPGFTGHVTLELSNAATLPIKLWPGMKIGQLCLIRLSSPAEHPYGSERYGSRYQGQRGPTPSRSFQGFHRTRV